MTLMNIFKKKKVDDAINLNDQTIQAIIDKEQNRNFFRIDLTNLLEGDMKIVAVNGQKVDLRHMAVLIDNIGPGGLSFICNIMCPVKKSIVLKFKTELLGKVINICGSPVWIKEMQGDLYKYGIEFTIDENIRTDLISILNQLQIKMRKRRGFTEGRFILDNNPIAYFRRVLDND